MIKYGLGDITQVDGVDFICNAANAIGPMGSGVAGAIRRAGGTIIQQQALIECSKNPRSPGELYITSAGSLPYRGVLHLVTMKEPGGQTNLNIISDCLSSLINYCREHNVKSVALSALGTGVGKMDKRKVAELFFDQLVEVPDIVFYVVDRDNEFIGHIHEFSTKYIDN